MGRMWGNAFKMAEKAHSKFNKQSFWGKVGTVGSGIGAFDTMVSTKNKVQDGLSLTRQFIEQSNIPKKFVSQSEKSQTDVTSPLAQTNL